MDNWSLLIKEYDHLIGKKFVNKGEDYTFFGLVHGSDDYYYGMCDNNNQILLISCVGDLNTYGFELK